VGDDRPSSNNTGKGDPIVMTKKNWSKYQTAVFENVATGTGHTVVKAVAGSGKTTTIVEALSHIPQGCSTLFVAFNKSIAEELAKRAPHGVEVSTLHSYGLKAITRSLGRLRIDARRVDDMVRAMHGDDSKTFDMRRDLAKTVSLAKGALASDENEIDALIDAFGIESARNGSRATFVQDVLKILEQCKDVQDGRIDFDDMIWLPVVLNLKQPQFDRVFVDETQDLNPAQIEMTMRAVKAGGRICAVGDPRQAIYRFRGADSAAVDNVVIRLDANVLPLSVCYRCCKEVIREAQTVVPEIEWAPDAEEGVVSDAAISEMKGAGGAQPGDFILSRTNAPLISLCMYFLKEGRPATIQGRDIGASLAAFVKKSKAPDVEALCDYVESWRDKECARLAAKHRDTQSVEDRAECILTISEGASSVADVINRIESLFADKDDAKRIVLSSTHKAKGMERDTVWVLASTYRRRPDVEEKNLYYVAVTRARKTLYLVQGEFSKKGRGQ
jgi:DNA helicase-2/ATP-dependent DNA helicase PcrA